MFFIIIIVHYHRVRSDHRFWFDITRISKCSSLFFYRSTAYWARILLVLHLTFYGWVAFSTRVSVEYRYKSLCGRSSKPLNMSLHHVRSSRFVIFSRFVFIRFYYVLGSGYWFPLIFVRLSFPYSLEWFTIIFSKFANSTKKTVFCRIAFSICSFSYKKKPKIKAKYFFRFFFRT